MTQDNARKEAIRQRMAETGEKYNVARRELEGTGTTAGDYLISDDETRRIAEGFLSASPWLGDVSWGEIVVGPGAEYLVNLWGEFEAPDELEEGQRWSWTVAFADPSGETKKLSHEVLLQGLRGLIYGDRDETGLESLDLLKIRQWFTEPASERRNLRLNGGDCSKICQHALYRHQVFSTNEHLFEKLDFFEDQRPPQSED